MSLPSDIPCFVNMGLAAELLRVLDEQGYQHPTQIQAQAIPAVLQGHDVMAVAQTGTGKTAAFSLPMIQSLLPTANISMSPARHPTRALILVPTRELANQVADNIKTYARYTALRIAVIFGGIDMTPQMTTLTRHGAEVVIGTPGRLLDHLQQKSFHLLQTQLLIMDEADRMLDMGFLPDLQKIIQYLPERRQNLMFSATFSQDIKQLAARFLHNPVIIEVAQCYATANNVAQTILHVEEENKYAAVLHLIHRDCLKQVIIFSNTKIGAERLTRYLHHAGLRVIAIHGDKAQSERTAALEAFKQGDVDILVATDVAARGLDIAELPQVINLDLPYRAEDYVHRIGRTGRAGAKGKAVSFYTSKDAHLLAEIEKLTQQIFIRGILVGSSWQKPKCYPVDKIDPWFLKPYEPDGTSVTHASLSNAPKATNRCITKRALLLGGTSAP